MPKIASEKLCACGCGNLKTGRSIYIEGHRPGPVFAERSEFCECGCGDRIPPPKSKSNRYHETRFLRGHYRHLQDAPNRYVPQPEEIPSGVCECGCGLQTPICDKTLRFRRWFLGYPRPFIPGHHARRSPLLKRRVREDLNLTVAEAAYLAGIIDGEGTISFRAGRSVRVSVANTDEDLMAWLQKIGGSRHLHTSPAHPNRRTCWRWWIGHRADVLPVLRFAEPYMIVKRDLAKRAIAILENIPV